MEEKYTYEIIKEAIKNNGIEEVRKIIYGESLQHEYIGMSKFIDSRQQWCIEDIKRKLTNPTKGHDMNAKQTAHTPTAQELLKLRPYEWSETQANYALKIISNHERLVEASSNYLEVTQNVNKYDADDYEIAKNNLIEALKQVKGE